MLGQSAGSMLLAWRCLRLFTPDIFVDTTGCHFTFLVAKLLAGCRVGCYVHYPTITTVSGQWCLVSTGQVCLRLDAAPTESACCNWCPFLLVPTTLPRHLGPLNAGDASSCV